MIAPQGDSDPLREELRTPETDVASLRERLGRVLPVAGRGDRSDHLCHRCRLRDRGSAGGVWTVAEGIANLTHEIRSALQLPGGVARPNENRSDRLNSIRFCIRMVFSTDLHGYAAGGVGVEAVTYV